ncbi:MAG: hypothetical protein ACJ714_11235 [Ornithinibacter sp.]
MSRNSDNEGLTLGYRFMWRLKYAGLHVFGPAQLGDERDPQRRLERERADKVEAARAARAARLAGRDRAHS